MQTPDMRYNRFFIIGLHQNSKELIISQLSLARGLSAYWVPCVYRPFFVSKVEIYLDRRNAFKAAMKPKNPHTIPNVSKQ